MKVKYIGKDNLALDHGQICEVISIEKVWYRVYTNIPNDFTGEPKDYLFPPKAFEIIDDQQSKQ